MLWLPEYLVPFASLFFRFQTVESCSLLSPSAVGEEEEHDITYANNKINHGEHMAMATPERVPGSRGRAAG